MEFRFQRSKAGAILSGIAFIILGIVGFTQPTNGCLFLTEVTGWVLIVLGVCSLVTAFMHFSIMLSQLDFYGGLLALLLGILVVNWPQFFVAWIFVLLGIYVMIAGFNSVFAANSLRMLGVSGSGGAMFGGFLMAFLGLLLMMSPFMMASVSMMGAGVTLVYAGVMSIVDGIRMKKPEEDL